MKQLTILLVISKINYGGASKMLTFLANSLAKDGHKVYIYTFAGDKSAYTLAKGVQFIPRRSKESGKYSIHEKLLSLFKFRSIITEINPDIIISFLTNGNFLTIIGSLFKNIPVIISERSDPYHEKSLLLKFMRLFYIFADGIVFQTEGAKNYYNKIVQRKSVIIANPVTIELEPRLPLHQRENNIAFVGRFHIKQKRQDLVIKAMSRVIEYNKNIKLVFYGDGPDLAKAKQMARERGILANVIFAGKVDNIHEKLKKSRLFVLTSDYEGIPNALIEAMASGLPVITTDCSPGGARLLVENKKNGLLVPKGNVDKIASAIIYLLENPDIAEQYGEEAQKIIERFSPASILQLWNEYIMKIYINR